MIIYSLQPEVAYLYPLKTQLKLLTLKLLFGLQTVRHDEDLTTLKKNSISFKKAFRTISLKKVFKDFFNHISSVIL